MKLDVKELVKQVNELMDKEIILEGWIKNHRKQKDFGFIEFYDGTHFKTVQIVYDNKLNNFEEIAKLRVGCAIKVVGKVQKSLGSGQEYEVVASDVTLLGDSPEDYPVQPKAHFYDHQLSLLHQILS